MTGYAFSRYEQFETSPGTIEQELRPAFCANTDRTILSKTAKEKDLGVTMNANMKVSEQCRIAASLGNQVFLE